MAQLQAEIIVLEHCLRVQHLDVGGSGRDRDGLGHPVGSDFSGP